MSDRFGKTFAIYIKFPKGYYPKKNKEPLKINKKKTAKEKK